MPTYEAVLNEALQLNPADRRVLVDQLLVSLDEECEFPDASLAEWRRRSVIAHEHPEMLIDWETVEAELFADTAD